jgi:arylsulfatase A
LATNMAKEKRQSTRKFIKRAGWVSVILAVSVLAFALLRTPPGPAYPDAYETSVDPLPSFAGEPPNIIIINADDLGYGDLSSYGSQTIETPNIDRLAAEGTRLTDFHASDAVCTPSRAGLLTGRYAVRMMLDTPLQPGNEALTKRALVRLGYLFGRLGLLDLAPRRAADGLHEAEITIAEALKAGGYRTGMVGKWHLGDYSTDPSFNPLRHGFDSYFGVPYSNDMHPFPLYRDEEELEPEVADQAALTGLYTQEAVEFIEEGGEQPFFLYFAHTFPHRPLFASEDFTGGSAAGLYGDVVQEIDGSVGRVMEALEDNGLAENTIVFFTSDNGPWYQGSPGPFRGRKGQAFEGGHRVPFIAWAPGRYLSGSVIQASAVNLDLFPTCLAVAGLALPEDRTIDGQDISSLLTGETDRSPHEYLYLYHQGELEGVRSGDWKYFRNTSHYTWPMPVNKKLGRLANHTTGPAPLLYDLSLDSGEAYNLARTFPGVVEKLEAGLAAWEAAMDRNPLGFR